MSSDQSTTENDNKQSWELSKENIQPLSSGRKMANLTRTLETSYQGLNEVEINECISKLEDEITCYFGDDPLEPWLKLIDYFEQNGLSCGKYNSRFMAVMNKCVRTFFNEEAQQNDKRFVDIFIKSVRHMNPERRIILLSNAMRQGGLGNTTSRMYITIADEYEQKADFKTANSVLVEGLTNNAQPKEYLEEAIANLQCRVAEAVRKSLEEDVDEGAGSFSLRAFGGSIPCAPTNEAPSIRLALSPANPSKSRPRNDMRKIALFANENEPLDEEPKPPATTHSNPLLEMDRISKEKENELNPTKWNGPTTQLPASELYADPSERIPIYRDSSASSLFAAVGRGQQSQLPIRSLRRPALGEIKDAEPTESRDEGNNTNANEIGQQAPIPPAVNISKKTPTVLPPPSVPAPVSTATEPSVPPEPSKTPTVKLMYRYLETNKNGVDVSFEQLRAAAYRKKKAEKAMDLARSMPPLPTVPAPKDPRIQELEEESAALQRRLQVALDAAEKQNQELAYYQADQEAEVQRLVRLERIQCIEESKAEFIKLSREKAEVLTQMRQEKLHRLRLEDESAKKDEENLKLSMELEAVKMEVRRLGDQLSVLQFQTPLPVSRGQEFGVGGNAGGFELYADTSILPIQHTPIPENRYEFQDQDKENLMGERESTPEHQAEEKPRRALSGILLPSLTAEPQALVFEEDLYNDTEIIIKKNETAVDFNVSNLTRALDCYPHPLINSTPERVSTSGPPRFNGGGGVERFQAPSSGYGPSATNPAVDLLRTTAASYERHEYTLPNVQNLSTIQETSKENRSSCTTSSSSSNSNGTTFSSMHNYTKSAKRNQASYHNAFQ